MGEITRTHVSKKKLMALLPDPGAPGWTSYATPGSVPLLSDAGLDPEAADRFAEIAEASDTGSVLFAHGTGAMLVVPPFPIEEADSYSELYPRPLVDLLERPRSVAVFLLRKGGFTTGFFRGGALVDSKTDRRFVKNRHRKGGQSQRRFDRIREKQVYELFEMACEDARETLEPYVEEIEWVLLGGDRHTLQDFRKQCRYFDRFGASMLNRTLLVTGDPRRASLEQAPHEIWSSEVYVAVHDPAPAS
jgi:hypothetical protein